MLLKFFKNRLLQRRRAQQLSAIFRSRWRRSDELYLEARCFNDVVQGLRRKCEQFFIEALTDRYLVADERHRVKTGVCS